VTDGFVTAAITKVNIEAQDLEQLNAEGRRCVVQRTPPERKWYTPVITLCSVNTGLITMFNGWEQVVDWNDMPIGFGDQSEVEGDFGTAVEIWTGGKAEDDCPVPTDDTVFAATSSGKSYGYFLFGGTEWELGDIEIGASVSNFTLTGLTVAMNQWGRGPYNVQEIDATGTPGRLLVPLPEDRHLTAFRTKVPPPEITDGGNPVPLDIQTRFVAPDYYYGGPASAPAADVAPEQFSQTNTVTVATAATAFVLTYNGQPTTSIAHTASTPDASVVQTALEGLSNVAPGEVAVSGSAGGPYTVSFVNTGTLTGSATGGTITIG
jgi:hypothetical protein